MNNIESDCSKTLCIHYDTFYSLCQWCCHNGNCNSTSSYFETDDIYADVDEIEEDIV